MAYELKQEKLKLKDVLNVVNIPEATYYNRIKQLMKEDPDKEIKEIITTLFHKHEGKYGYRRIHLSLRAKSIKINHKKVQRLMQELGLKCIKFTRKSLRTV